MARKRLPWLSSIVPEIAPAKRPKSAFFVMKIATNAVMAGHNTRLDLSIGASEQPQLTPMRRVKRRGDRDLVVTGCEVIVRAFMSRGVSVAA